MPPVIRANFDDLMQVNGYWQALINTEDFDRPEDFVAKLFDRKSIGKKDAKYSEMAGLSTMVQANEYGDWNYDDPIQGYDKTLTPVPYNLAVLISREAWDDDQVGELKKYASWFKASDFETDQILGHNILNNGFATTTTADGSYLFATDHPLLGGGTYRNKLSTDSDLSLSSLEQAIIDIQNTTDDRGKKINLGKNKMTLFVPLALQFTAGDILKSPGKHDSANLSRNPMKDMDITLVVDPYITDDDSWFITCMSTSDKKFPLKALDRLKMETKISRLDDKSGNPFLATAYKRAAFGAVYWRGIFGTPGAT